MKSTATEIRQATMADLEGVMALHKRYHTDSIPEADRPDGFVTTNFTPVQLENLVTREDGVTLALQGGVVVGYAMAASWAFWAEWPLFAHMIDRLPQSSFEGRPLSAETSYQYGPICVDASVRGTGVFQRVFHASLAAKAGRWPVMVTFINQINPRSYAAHTRKVPMATVGTFRFNHNDYYMLACATRACSH